MVANGNGGGKFGHWMSSGLLATIAWFVVLIIYCIFKAVGIDDPLLGQAFLLLTGAWVGNLTLAQGKKQAKVEENAAEAKMAAADVERIVEKLVRRADVSEQRADVSEEREAGWSKHKDHKAEE
jgi:hypothetical protein